MTGCLKWSSIALALATLTGPARADIIPVSEVDSVAVEITYPPSPVIPGTTELTGTLTVTDFFSTGNVV